MLVLPYLIAIMVFGIIGTYTDIRKSIIKNWMIVMMLSFKITIDAILILTRTVTLPDIITTYINIIIALIVSSVLWLIGFWSPGDAKFFSMMVGFIPIEMYPLNRIVVIDVLPFVIIPGVLALLLIAIIRSSKKQKSDAVRKILDPKTITTNILSIFWISWIVAAIGKIFLMRFNPAIYFVFFLAINYLMNRFIPEKKLYVAAMFSILRILFDLDTLKAFDFWINFAISSIIFVIILNVISYLGNSYFTPKKKDLGRVFPGNTVAENFIIRRNIDDHKKYRIVKASREIVKELLSPGYSLDVNWSFFMQVTSIKRTKFFPESNESGYLFSKSDKEMYSSKKALLENMKVKRILVEDSLVFGPYIFAGMVLFAINAILHLI